MWRLRAVIFTSPALIASSDEICGLVGSCEVSVDFPDCPAACAQGGDAFQACAENLLVSVIQRASSPAWRAMCTPNARPSVASDSMQRREQMDA